MNVLIADERTETYIRMLARAQNTTLTKAVEDAVVSRLVELELLDLSTDDEVAALEASLGDAMRELTRGYVVMLEEITGKQSGSRVYQMLARHGASETLRRIIAQETTRFKLVLDLGRPELAFENLAVDPRYKRIVDAETRRIAVQRLKQM